MRRRTHGTTTIDAGQQPVPRDVEAVEAVVNALDAGVTDPADAHRVIVTTLTRELDIAYGAAWLPAVDGGGFTLAAEVGRLVWALSGSGVDR